MKKNLILLMISLLLPLGIMAEDTHLKVALTEAGTLQETVENSSLDFIDSLTVSGKFNAIDLKYLREPNGRMEHIVYLDLTDIEIVECEEYYFSYSDWSNPIKGYTIFYYLSSNENVILKEDYRHDYYLHYSPNLDNCFVNNVLKEIRMPRASHNIGASAFKCNALEKVVLPVGCKGVGYKAFTNCDALITLVNTETIDSIDSYAFSGTKVNATFAPLRYVGNDAFNGASIESISFKDGIATIPEKSFYECKNLKEILIPGSAESIGASAFYGCSGAEKIIVGEGTRDIGDYCFKGCTSATDFTLPSTIRILGYQALDGVPLDDAIDNGIMYVGTIAYKQVDSSTDISIRTGTTCIADNFSSGNLTSLSLPTSLKAIGNNAFNCTETTNEVVQLDLPKGLEEIGKSAFEGWTKLSSITIPANVKYLGAGAFMGCEALVSVNWNAEDCQLVKTDNISPFSQCTGIETVNIGEGVKRIPADCFDNLESLSKVTISSTVEEIGDATPYNNDSDENIYGGFEDCPKLETVVFANDSKLKIIGKGAFQYCTALKEITIPANVELIAKEAFSNCNALGTIIFPSSLTSVEDNAFYGYEGEKRSVYVPDLASWCKIQFGNIEANPATGNQTTLYVNGEQLPTDLVIPEGVTSVGSFTFYGKQAITSVTTPSSLTSIGKSAFSECQSLSTLNLNEGLKTIDDGAFSNCKALEYLELPEGVETIGELAFNNCEIMNPVYIPSSMTSIGEKAFNSDRKIKTVYIPDLASWFNIKFGGMYANPFSEGPDATLVAGGKEIIDVVVPSGIKAINDYVFYNNWNIQTVTIPNGVTTIGKSAFRACYNIKSVSIPKTVTFIDQYAFSPSTMHRDYIDHILCYITEPFEIDEYTFHNMTSTTLYVPEGTVDKYKAMGWDAYFADIVEMEVPETVSITISKSGKISYTTGEALDFGGFEDLKAYVATGFDQSGTIWLTRVKQVPAGTPILIKGTPEKSYEVPIMDKCVAYFENMFQGSASEDLNIDVTSADGKWNNYYIASGAFKKVTGPRTIDAGKCYLQLPANFKAAKVGEDQTVKIADSGKSSYAPPVDIDLTGIDDLKAYAATGYDAESSTIWLTRIFKIQAGEGVMLKGEAGKTYTLPSAEVQAYYGNLMIGNIGNPITINETSDDGEWTNFYLASGSFKKVSGSREIGTNKSYLHLPASMLVSSARGKQNAGIDEWFMEELETETILLGSIGGDDEDGTTRINAIANDNAQPDVYYNLQGQRINNPKKGLYIKNGKKVVIK